MCRTLRIPRSESGSSDRRALDSTSDHRGPLGDALEPRRLVLEVGRRAVEHGIPALVGLLASKRATDLPGEFHAAPTGLSHRAGLRSSKAAAMLAELGRVEITWLRQGLHGPPVPVTALFEREEVPTAIGQQLVAQLSRAAVGFYRQAPGCVDTPPDYSPATLSTKRERGHAQ